jgi:hypothetical protein
VDVDGNALLAAHLLRKALVIRVAVGEDHSSHVVEASTDLSEAALELGAIARGARINENDAVVLRRRGSSWPGSSVVAYPFTSRTLRRTRTATSSTCPGARA